MTACVILQPSYIPWRGYFHQIRKADVFVFYDDVQYDKRGWRNRNRVKTAHGSTWLTIPAVSRGAQLLGIPINEVAIDWTKDWARKHWATIDHAYHRAPFFSRYAPMIREFYERHDELLADFTVATTVAIARELGANPRFVRSSALHADGAKTERLLSVLSAVGATHYVSGPSARDYIDEQQFAAAGVTLEYMSYSYREYAQLHPPYDPQVSILDLLFMVGPDAPDYIWGQRP